MRRHLHLFALLTPVILAACLDPDPLPESNYGVIGLGTVISGADTLVSPIAIFYRTGPLILPTSSINRDQCVVAPFPTTGDQGTARSLRAGDSVAITTVTDTVYLVPTIDLNRELYVLRATDEPGLPFHPGEAVTISVPGAPGGFSNGTISVLTALPFEPGPINPSPAEGDSLDITWTPPPAGDDSTKIVMSLQYGLGGVEANRQLSCEFVDDGAVEIPPAFLTEWRSATTGSRSVVATRLRIATRQVTDGVLLVVSAFEVEEPVD